MSKVKKILCLLLAVLMVLTMNIPVFANDNIAISNNVSTVENAKPIEITVSTDKSSYKTTNIATINVTVKNVSDESLENVKAQVVFDDLQPVSRKNSTTSKEVSVLQAGESFEFSYKATLNINKHNLNFFQKIFLWFVRLFNGGYTISSSEMDAIVENVTEIRFGKYLAENFINVTYSDSVFSDEELKQMQEVDIAIDKFLDREELDNLSKNEKINAIKDYLVNLSEKGTQNMPTQLIIPGSIHYDEETEIIYFRYSCGVSSGILVKEYNNMLANRSIDNAVLSSSTKYGDNNDINSILMYGWDDGLSKTYSDYDGFVKEISRFGICSTMYTHPTVEDYKTAFLSMNFIFIAEHGIVFYDDETQENLCCFGVYGDKVSEGEYLSDIDNKFIYKLYDASLAGEPYHALYLISPKFFEHYYNDKLQNSIVVVGSCSSFGNNGKENYSLASALHDICGADVVVGFHNTVYIAYSLAIMKNFTINVLCGNTPDEALTMAKDKYGNDDITYMFREYSQYDPVWWNTPDKDKDNKTGHQQVVEKFVSMGASYPCIYGNKYNHYIDSKGGNVSGTVKDETTGNAISGVRVEFIDNSTDNLTPVATTTTNENGLFSVNLPFGSYSLSFKHNSFEEYGMQLSIDCDNIVINDPILLNPKKVSSDTVEFNGNYYKLFDLSLSWEEAKAYCENLGGHLVTITSSNEQEFIEDNLLSNSVAMNYYFLGGFRENLSEEWYWITNEDFVYSNWNLDEEATQQINGQNYIIIGGINATKLQKKFSWISHHNIDDSYQEWATKYTGFICEWENSSNIETDNDNNDINTENTCITSCEIIDYGRYTGNQGDSCVFHLDKSGLPGADNTYCRNGNIGIDGTAYNNGLEVWIARWNFKSEKSFAYATYKLNGIYQKLSGKTGIINSYNTTNFDTTVYFYNGDTLLQKVDLTNSDYAKNFSVDVSDVKELKILVEDNNAVAGGTSFALYDMFLT